jgi:hypothetical protein
VTAVDDMRRRAHAESQALREQARAQPDHWTSEPIAHVPHTDTRARSRAADAIGEVVYVGRTAKPRKPKKAASVESQLRDGRLR